MVSHPILASLKNFWNSLDQRKNIIVIGVPLFLLIGIMALIKDKSKHDVKKMAIHMCRVISSSPATREARLSEARELQRVLWEKYPAGKSRDRFMASWREFDNLPRNKQHALYGRCDSMSW